VVRHRKILKGTMTGTMTHMKRSHLQRSHLQRRLEDLQEPNLVRYRIVNQSNLNN
jgi:hypothetical protein